MKFYVACLSVIAWLGTVGVSSQVRAADTDDQAALEAAAQAWMKAFNARDAKTLLALGTEDLIVLDPNLRPVSGAAAREAWKKSLGATQGRLTSVTKEIVISADIAWRISVLSDRDSARPGQALEIWKRVGGEWKIHRQMISNVLTSPGLLPTPSEPVLDRPAN